MKKMQWCGCTCVNVYMCMSNMCVYVYVPVRVDVMRISPLLPCLGRTCSSWWRSAPVWRMYVCMYICMYICVCVIKGIKGCGWVGVRESGEQHTMTTDHCHAQYPPPDRESIATSVSCVQHPPYLKTYLCDVHVMFVLCVMWDVWSRFVGEWAYVTAESNTQWQLNFVKITYPPPDRERKRRVCIMRATSALLKNVHLRDWLVALRNTVQSVSGLGIRSPRRVHVDGTVP